MKKETISYNISDDTFEGVIYLDDSSTKKRPGILVAHTWVGRNAFSENIAKELAKLGYIAFAIDLYGKGIQATSDNEALMLMKPLFMDRKLLQTRMLEALTKLKQHPLVGDVGAIGFCFGGLSVIELLKCSNDIKGVVSFHAVLGNTLGEFKAERGLINKKIEGSLLVLHGFDDPLVTKEDISNLENELNASDADWQIHIFGKTSHAFMNEDANKPEIGLCYNERTAKRAWSAMINFFKEIFNTDEH